VDYEKDYDFRTISRFISETIQDRTINYNGRRIETRVRSVVPFSMTLDYS